jgi:hypothetical protein
MKHFLCTAVVSCYTCFAYALSPQADTALIRNHLKVITKTDGFRHHGNTDLLDKTATYIFRHFKTYADSSYYQDFQARGLHYRNVICEFGPKNGKLVVIGAHYDVCGDQEGADDNASGVTGLLELARMLKGQALKCRVQLVAYSLEEPPYFETEQMGSYVHAKSLHDAHTDIYGMISLEMIGYFKDEKNSQDYPAGFLKYIYGKKGNYITMVKKFGSGKFARKFSRRFKRAHTVRTKKFTAPASMEGIDYSDHRNYWMFGYSALMITDTSFFRNAHYHEKTDTLETLHIPRMAGVINGVFKTLVSLK